MSFTTMQHMLSLAVLLLALFVWGGQASEVNNTAGLRKGVGITIPCNCTEWTCPRTFKHGCPPGPKCKHSQCKPVVAPDGWLCNPDNKCEIGPGKCWGGICKGKQEKTCPPSSNECKILKCNPSSGDCTLLENKPDFTPCRGGECRNGDCIRPTPPSPSPRPPRPCPKPKDPCLVSERNPTTGQCEDKPAEDGTKCNDKDKCTIRDQCVGGVCIGRDRNCPQPSNPCKEPTCNPLTGCGSANVEDGTECPLPGGEVGECVAGTCTDVTPETCPISPDRCIQNVPDPANPGQCKPEFTTVSCNDNNRCTIRDRCVEGVCKGTNRTCPKPSNPCKQATCNPLTGCESTNVRDGTECPLPGGGIGSCVAGDCTELSPQTCPISPDVCIILKPNPANTSECIPEFTTEPCDDGLDCTTGDRCDQGVCRGTSTCTTLNPCLVGTCSNATVPTGQCVFTPGNNGTTCDDGDVCTFNGTCSGGTCQRGPARSCPAPADPQCQDVTCNSNAATFEAACQPTNKPNDFPCISPARSGCRRDTCQNGQCTLGSDSADCSHLNSDCSRGECRNNACVRVPTNVNGTCSDGKFCTTNDKCNSEGICVGGPLETCDPQPANQCMRRYCNATSQQCVEEAKPDTTPCDRNGCTRDECRGGQCVGVQVKPGTPCSTSATCRTSTCNITTGVCDLSITFPGNCNDGNACTTGEQCLANGTCAGGAQKSCPPSTECIDYRCNPRNGNCDPVFRTGTCTNPTTPNQCKVGPFTCQSDGTCGGGTDRICPTQACRNVTCDAQRGCVYQELEVGDPCDDGNPNTCDETCERRQGSLQCVGKTCPPGSCPGTPCRNDECCCSGTCYKRLGNSCDITCDQRGCLDVGKRNNQLCYCIKDCGQSQIRPGDPSGCNSNRGNPCAGNGVCCCAAQPAAGKTWEDVCPSCRDPCPAGKSCISSFPPTELNAICTGPSVRPTARRRTP